jgi:hypothetical protein
MEGGYNFVEAVFGSEVMKSIFFVVSVCSGGTLIFDKILPTWLRDYTILTIFLLASCIRQDQHTMGSGG